MPLQYRQQSYVQLHQLGKSLVYHDTFAKPKKLFYLILASIKASLKASDHVDYFIQLEDENFLYCFVFIRPLHSNYSFPIFFLAIALDSTFFEINGF